jgi:uncharacterized membrane protein HdeD (DUF308 family)
MTTSSHGPFDLGVEAFRRPGFIVLIGSWRGVALRGAAAVGFGLLALLWPGLTLTVLVLLFGAYALIDGAALLVDAVRVRGALRRPWLVALEGIASVVAGAITLIWPGITALALLWVLAAWALVTGVLEVWAAFRTRPDGGHDWFIGLLGVLSLVLAGILVIDPATGALGITWALGWYGLLFGGTLLWLAHRIRRLGEGLL